MVPEMTPEEEAAYKAFLLVRWPETGGEPVCPRCASRECYNHKNRQIFQCKSCKKQYSASAGTIFNGRKLSYVELMNSLELIRDQNQSTVELAKSMSVQQQTAWHLKKRVKEYLTDGHPTLKTQ